MVPKERRVLLAEHDKSIAEILKYLLNAWDYEIIISTDGISTLDMVRREQPDIILIDSNLPKMDGLQVSKVLKEDFLTAHIPVIILIDKKQIRKKMLEIEQGVDDYIKNPPDPIDLEVRLEMALRRTSHQLHANALTRLPGNRQIEKIVQSKIEEDAVFSVAYYDIDNFKSFNDKYGYIKGDAVIRHTAYIISTTVKRYGHKNDFVGHIGGDDFIVVTVPECERLIATESISRFNALMPFHYSEEDRVRGYVVVKDRRGNISNVPLMSISIAIVNNKERKLQNIIELTEIITEIKSYLKTLQGSNFLVNRRASKKKEPGRQYQDANIPYITARAIEKEKKYRPLGQILVESNIISPQQLELALDKHWSTGQKIGESIVDLGMATSSDIARALENQLNVPHFNIGDFDKNGELESLVSKIPFVLMKDHFVVPVNKDKNFISLAMVNPRDNEIISKVEKLTGCSVTPFFVLENEFDEIWRRMMKKSDKTTAPDFFGGSNGLV